MPDTFLVDYATDNGTAVVRFVGELDVATAPRAEEAGLSALARMESDGAPIVFDMSELAFCDSSGLRALLAIAAKATAAGHLVTLRKPNIMLRRMLELTDLRKLFAIDE